MFKDEISSVVLQAVVLVFAVAAAFWWLSPGDKSASDETDPSTQPATASQPEVFEPSHRQVEGPFHGLAIQVYSAERAAERYSKLINEVAQLGADTVLLSINGYQQRVDSTLIDTKPGECPPDEVWLQLFEQAHAAGMKVVLMPKILLTDPNGAWRGKIQPPSWDAWFAQYGRFVLRFAELAERGRVEVFIVGSELVSSEKMTEHWRALIGRVRDVFQGKIAYSANWDHYTGIQFWDDLDIIGLTTYHRLADEPGPTVEQLREAWQPIRDNILSWQQEIGKPILFTEAGWCSQEGCSMVPWNYYHNESATPAGHEEQRNNYRAFIDTWADQPQVCGIIWWEWTESPGGPQDYSYTPRNKPAAAVLRDLFSGR